MNSKEELMQPILLLGFIWLFIFTIIFLLLFLSRLYVYYKCKKNLMPTKANVVREQKESKKEDNTEETKASKKERSSYYYSGRGKLFPEDKDFVENATWSVSLLKLYKEDKLNRMRRSNYFYEGEDKLFPEDDLFFDNTTWTFSRKKQHKNKKERMLPNFKTGFLRKNNQKSFL